MTSRKIVRIGGQVTELSELCQERQKHWEHKSLCPSVCPSMFQVCTQWSEAWAEPNVDSICFEESLISLPWHLLLAFRFWSNLCRTPRRFVLGLQVISPSATRQQAGWPRSTCTVRVWASQKSKAVTHPPTRKDMLATNRTLRLCRDSLRKHLLQDMNHMCPLSGRISSVFRCVLIPQNGNVHCEEHSGAAGDFGLHFFVLSFHISPTVVGTGTE